MSDDPSEPELPAPPDVPEGEKAELTKLYYKAQLDLRASWLAFDQAARKAFIDADLKGVDAYHAATIEVAKGSIERARGGAEAVRNAAAAVGVLYSAVLGVAFSVDKPLPVRGLIPTVFLGLAIVLATAYVAWLAVNPATAGWPVEGGSYRQDQRSRTKTFVDWVKGGVLYKGYSLRAAVLALGFGILFLPVGFVGIGGHQAPSEATSSWPTTPTEVTDPELRKILYTAMVEEAASAREKELDPSTGEDFEDTGVRIVYATALAGLLGVFLLAWILGRGVSMRARVLGGLLLGVAVAVLLVAALVL